MMPICTHVQMLQMAVPLVTVEVEFWFANRFSHAASAVECFDADKTMKASATARARETKMALNRALEEGRLAREIGGRRRERGTN